MAIMASMLMVMSVLGNWAGKLVGAMQLRVFRRTVPPLAILDPMVNPCELDQMDGRADLH